MHALPAALFALALAAAPAGAAPAQKGKAKTETSTFSTLMSRISKYLNSEPVRKARVAAAVAAVRGGIPTDQGEDLDQRLLDRAVVLREKVLAGSGADEARKSLRPIYSALAVSQWVQSLEGTKDPGMQGELSKLLTAWSKDTPSAPKSLRDALSGLPDALDSKALVASGWGSYCRSITPSVTSAGGGAAATFDAETAKLDEALASLKRSWLEKKLPDAEASQAHALAGQVYAGLSQAPLKAVAVEAGRTAAGSKDTPAAPAPAPRRVAAEAMGDSGPDFVPRRIYDRAARAVVLIICGDADGQGELGSGSIIDERGRVLTNAHVVIRDSSRQPWPEVRVYLKPSKMTGDPKIDVTNPRRAKVVAWDNALDLALIQMEDPPSGAPSLSLADPDDMMVGDRVAAIGHPEQGGLWTLTTGVISTLAANLGGVQGKNAFQTDASINRGNSGGPLLNAYGDIVGVNTLMSRKAADGLAITAVNFAVKSDVARSWMAKNGSNIAFAKIESGSGPAKTPETYASAAPPAVPAPAIIIPPTAANPTGATPSASKIKREMVSESKPYDREKLIEEEIKEMEDLESEMMEEVRKRR